MFTGLFLLCALAFVVLMIASLWVVFTKAGKPGWAAIVPVYNIIVKLEIVGRPLWWILLMFLPLVNIAIWIVISIDLAKSFGKDVGYGVGLALLPFIFHPMLAFGDATYRGRSVASG
jgi:hypothetical protein